MAKKETPEVKKIKKQLREHFSIEQDGEMVVGPAEVEVTEAEAEAHAHKFEPEEKKGKKAE